MGSLFSPVGSPQWLTGNPHWGVYSPQWGFPNGSLGIPVYAPKWGLPIGEYRPPNGDFPLGSIFSPMGSPQWLFGNQPRFLRFCIFVLKKHTESSNKKSCIEIVAFWEFVLIQFVFGHLQNLKTTTCFALPVFEIFERAAQTQQGDDSKPIR